MKYNSDVILYNITLLLLSMMFIFLLIQHAIFFYSFPPDFKRYVDVPFITYPILGILCYLIFKFHHFVEERGEMFPSEEELWTKEP